MKILMVCYKFPPQIDGIGDYTFHISQELIRSYSYEIKVFSQSSSTKNYENLEVINLFNPVEPQSLLSLIKVVEEETPDCIIFHYNPFAYGYRFGINPFIPLMLNSLRLYFPKIKIVIIIHESFIPIDSFKSFLLSHYLSCQLWLSCQNSDVLIPVIKPWLSKLKNWFPKKTICQIPVGSNIPYLIHDVHIAKKSMGINSDQCVLGFFGRVPRKMIEIEYIVKSVRLLQDKGFNPVLLYLGTDEKGAKLHFGEYQLITSSSTSPSEISQQLHAVDIFLVPTHEGLSTRKTSFMAGIQHGLSTVAILGESTDEILVSENRRSFILTESGNSNAFAQAVLELAENPSLKQSIAEEAQNLYTKEFSWERITSQLVSLIDS